MIYPSEHDQSWYSDPGSDSSGRRIAGMVIGEDCCVHGIGFDEDCERCDEAAEDALLDELESNDAE